MEGSIKSWDNEHLLSIGGDKSYTGKISVNSIGRRTGRIYALPYAFAGFGLTSGGPITQDVYGLRTFGVGVKAFVVKNTAIRIEYSHTAYPSFLDPFDADFWGGGWQSDKTFSFGLSCFAFVLHQYPTE